MARQVHSGPVVGFACAAGLLLALAGSAGLGAAGWLAGLASAGVLTALLDRGLERHRRVRLSPADRVTLTRAVLACTVAALVADALTGPGATALLVSLAALALALDAVDGPVARRTGSGSAFGARFDLEADAFLILVLSVAAVPAYGWWVLGIGLFRYAFVASGLLLPWLRGTVPPRPWCKVVAAIQGVVLTVAVSGLLPPAVATVLVAGALVLLVESFGREVGELWLLEAARRGGRAAPARARLTP